MKNIFIIYAVLFGAFIGISLPLPLLGPLVMSESSPFSIALEQRYLFLSLAIAAFPLGSLIGAPLLGFISDRLGQKRVLLMGLSGGSLFYVLSGIAIDQGSIYLLLLARFLCGLCEGNAAIAQSYIAKGAGLEAKAKLMGRMIAVMSLGYVAGPLIGGLLTNASLFSLASEALPFYFVGGFIALTALCVGLGFESKTEKLKPVPSGLITDLKELFKEPLFTHLLVLTLLLAMGRSLFIDFFASFLNLSFAITSKQGTWLWVLLAIIWGVTALFCDSAKERMSYQTKIILACGLAGASVMLITLSHSLITLTILSSFLVIGLALAGAINAVLVSDATPKPLMGLSMGLLSSTYLCGEVFASLGGGHLLSLSLKAPFLVGGGLLWTVSAGFLLKQFPARRALDSEIR